MGRHGAILKSVEPIVPLAPVRAATHRYRRRPSHMNMPHRTPPSRSARNRLIRRRPCGELGEPPQVLCDGHEGEFELGAAGPPEAQSEETQDALQVSEQHLDLFAIATRLRVGNGFGKCSRDIARLLIDVTNDSSRGHVWATFRF
jgi:hypothetical protein